MFPAWRNIGSLPREVWVLFVTNLINRMGTMGLPFLVIYLTKSQGFSATEAGFVLSVYGIGALLTAPLAGRLSDRVGPLRVMKLSLLLSAFILALFPFARGYGVILAMVILWAVTGEAYRPASLTIITDAIEPERRRIVFSLNRLAINIGMSIGPAVGGFLLAYSFPLIFWVDGATSFIAFALFSIALRKYEHRHGQPGEFLEFGKSLFDDTRILVYVAIVFWIFVTFFQHASTLPYVCIGELHLSPSFFGLMFTINTSLIILFEVPMNFAMQHWPHKYTLALGSILCGLGYGGMMFATGLWSVIVTVVLWSFGEIIFVPSATAYMSDIAPPQHRGASMGLFQMVGNAAFAFSGWFGMRILERFGSTVLWGTTFLFCIIPALLLWRVARPVDK